VTWKVVGCRECVAPELQEASTALAPMTAAAAIRTPTEVITTRRR
jgi:hypothetical protein